LFHDDIKLTGDGGTIVDKTAIPVLAIHTPLLFSDATVSAVLLTAVDGPVLSTDALTNLNLIRSNWVSEVANGFTVLEEFVAQVSLLFGVIARFRLWGTACGIHVHDCTDVMIDECDCIGQMSEKDNAVGVLFSGLHTTPVTSSI